MNKKSLIFYGTKPGSLPDEHKSQEQQKERKITMKLLVKQYLCLGETSPCVVNRKCPSLDACMYGQEYIRMTGETKK